MAKTSSQIAAERKLVSDYRKAVHQQQMAEVGAKNAARTKAVYEKAASITKDTAKKAHYLSAANSVKDNYSKAKTAQDMQKKKEDRAEGLFGTQAERQARNARKALQEYKLTDEYRKNQKKIQQDQYVKGILFGVKPEYEADDKEKQLQKDVDYWENKVNQEKNARITERNMAVINAMDEAERAAFEKYVSGGLYTETAEVEAHKALRKKYGDTLDKLKESYDWYRNEQAAKEVTEKAAAMTETGVGKAAHSLLSIPASIAGGVTGTAARINELFNRTGQYKSLSPYTQGDHLSLYAQTVQGETVKDILDGQEADYTDGITGREAGAALYQGIMGAAETGGRMLASFGNPVIAAGLAATSSFSNTMREATAQGASPEQAMALATINSGIEALTEKLPLDELFKMAKGGAKPAAKVIGNILKQAGIEILEEEASLIATTLAEAAILQEKSSYNQQVMEAMANGATEEEARTQANRALLAEAINTAIVSGISGAASAAGAEIIARHRDGNWMTNGFRETMRKNNITATPERTAVGENMVGDRIAVRDMVQGQAHLPENQSYNWGIKKDAPLGGAGHTPNGRTSYGASSDASTNSIPNNEPKVNESIDSTQQVDTSRQSTGGVQQADGVDIGKSRTFTNTGIRNADADVRNAYGNLMQDNLDVANYTVKHRADTLNAAKARLGSPEKIMFEYDNLMEKPVWDADDVATTNLLQGEILRSGDQNAAQKFQSLAEKKKQMAVFMGQATDAFRIQDGTMEVSKNAATAVDHVINSLDSMDEAETTYRARKNGPSLQQWKAGIKDDVTRIGIAVELVEDGDTAQMRNVIQQIARYRKTTAFFGLSGNLTYSARRILNKLDFETLKTIANTQIASMADDYRSRKVGNVVSSIRKQNMLMSLKTFGRNIIGNTTVGIVDSMSDSGAGQMADFIMSKATGKRTVGNDMARGGTYLRAAKDAADFASLCIELNVPIETDAVSALSSAMGTDGNSKYIGKTFRANGNPAMRAMYAVQKYMSYALEASDKIFEGGSNAAVTESLNRLKNANLTDEEINRLGEYAGDRRTFKDATWEDASGNTHGAVISRKTADILKPWGPVGDVIVPFVKVGSNMAQTAIDYTTGIAKGAGEIASIIRDARSGKEIPVERQRQAASDFGRGISGTSMIALFTAAAAMGVIKVSEDDDWDKEALALAEGRSGAQINWSALERGLNGGSAEWQDADTITGLDFLEPFNTQLYLGYELSKEESLQDIAKAYPGATLKSVANSIMDSPVMTGLAEAEELLRDILEAENVDDVKNAAAEYGGDIASSFIPQFVRQTAQLTDGYYRDTTGDTPIESATNKIKAAIPGQSQSLPVKYNGLGEIQERPGFVGTFLDPTGTTQYMKNEVITYLDDLAKQTGNNTIYPDRQAPKSFQVNGKEVVVSGKEMTEKYQKTYGEKNNELFSALINYPGFDEMHSNVKTKAFEMAKDISARFARATVSEYRDVPKGDTAKLIESIIIDSNLGLFSTPFSYLSAAMEFGYDTKKSEQDMQWAYNTFAALRKDVRQGVMDESTGDVKKYLEVRSKGVEHDDFVSTLKTLESLKPEADYGEVREIQNREAIANMKGISDQDKDILMKAYMDDYDPDARTVHTTELKYDYARQVLGLSPAEYVATYRVSLDGGDKEDKLKKWQAMGYSADMAEKLYRLYDATGKTKIDVIGWYNNR